MVLFFQAMVRINHKIECGRNLDRFLGIKLEVDYLKRNIHIFDDLK
jgi:hypothetical protein